MDVRAIRLDGWRGILPWPTQPGTCFADEIGGRVRVIACLDRMPNLFHSELRDGEVAGAPDRRVWEEVRRECAAGADDAVVLVWGPARDTATAAQEILIRAAEAAEGDPAKPGSRYPGGRPTSSGSFPDRTGCTRHRHAAQGHRR